MSGEAPIGRDDIHAYVDGRLDAARRRAVEAHLAAHPEDAARAEAYRRQNAEMRRLFDPVLAEPVPSRLLHRRRARRREAGGMPPARRSSYLRMAASVLWLTIGLATGWVAHERLMPPAAQVPRAVAQQAVEAHLVYASEVRHPVEVGAEDSDHLFKWLSNRLGASIAAPDLQPAGFRLVGGRLLPAAGGPAAQFMYENVKGERVTLHVSKAAVPRETAFRYAHAHGVAAVWWIDGGFAFALVGQLDQRALQRVAHLAYEGLGG